MLTTIKLTGILGEKFIPEMQADVSNFKEVLSCLFANFPEFKNYILSQNIECSISVIKDGWEQRITEDNLEFALMPLGGSTVILCPMLAGSGESFGGLVRASVLIGIGLIPGIGSVGSYLVASGVSMALQTILYGYPKKPDKEENTAFFQSSGVVTQEGTPVPLVFGEVLVKTSQVLSLKVTSEYKSL
jgi:predicted phage tail protein